MNIHWKDWCWSWSSNTLTTRCKEPTHWKRPWCWARLKAGEGDRRRDGWMASPTQWTWVWASSRSWWWTGKPGMLQSMGWQKVRHKWANELNTDTQNLRSKIQNELYFSLFLRNKWRDSKPVNVTSYVLGFVSKTLLNQGPTTWLI